mmetsp:Transcript_21844/g.30384  ORF Transcript_21844/g.30384 Transcript_21844/m.30384 type:complete len:84 (+) Transcript_21844:149-400(+)
MVQTMAPKPKDLSAHTILYNTLRWFSFGAKCFTILKSQILNYLQIHPPAAQIGEMWEFFGVAMEIGQRELGSFQTGGHLEFGI